MKNTYPSHPHIVTPPKNSLNEFHRQKASRPIVKFEKKFSFDRQSGQTGRYSIIVAFHPLVDHRHPVQAPRNRITLDIVGENITITLAFAKNRKSIPANHATQPRRIDQIKLSVHIQQPFRQLHLHLPLLRYPPPEASAHSPGSTPPSPPDRSGTTPGAAARSLPGSLRGPREPSKSRNPTIEIGADFPANRAKSASVNQTSFCTTRRAASLVSRPSSFT